MAKSITQLDREIDTALAGIDTVEAINRKFRSRPGDAVALVDKARQAYGASKRWHKRSAAYAREGQFREAAEAEVEALSLGRMAADLEAEAAQLRSAARR